MDNSTAELLNDDDDAFATGTTKEPKRQFLLSQEGTASFDSGAMLCALC
jgi:hypothetical protein